MASRSRRGTSIRPATALDRRRLLALLGGGSLALLVPACSAGSGDGTVPVEGVTTGEGGAGTAVTVPATPTLEAERRDLHVRLVASKGQAEIVAGRSTPVLQYRAEVLAGDPAAVVPSGSYLGPTLHVRQGQRLQVSFVNELDEDSIVHWHGLSVTEPNDGGPLYAVGPGKNYEYDFVVDSEPGTFWYHPHPHHHTGEQVYRGLAGMVVVHGDEPAALAGLVELPMVLQDRTIGTDGTLRYATTQHDRMAGFVGDTLVTNGVADYTVTVARRPHRLRLLNGANSRTQHLIRSDGAPFRVIATDGAMLPEALTVTALVLTPAQRSDVWIDFSGEAPGTRIELLAADTFTETGMGGGGMGGGMGGGTGASGGAVDAPLTLDHRVAATFVVGDGPSSPAAAPAALGTVRDIDPATAVNAAAPKSFVLSTQMMTHLINGLQWEGKVATELETVRAGTVELWEFENRSPMAHPMHLHGLAFGVVGRTWISGAAPASWAAVADGVIDSGRRDTVLVWPGQRVRLAVRFGEHRGYFPYHCHILEHEDAGMMRNFRVI